MTTTEQAQHKELCQHREELQRSLALCEAAIARLEGKPAKERFELMMAGEVPYSHDHYIALRVEEYRASGKHYVYESAEDRALIEAAAGTLPAANEVAS